MIDFGVLSNAAGALLFLILTGLLLPSWRRRPHDTFLIIAALASSLWFGATALYYGGALPVGLTALRVVEVLRNAAWFAFLLTILSLGTSDRKPHRNTWIVAVVVAVACLAVWALIAFDLTGVDQAFLEQFVDEPTLAGLLILSVIGLLLVEQVFRNTTDEGRWAIKFLCFGIGGFFAYDFFLYSNAVLFNRIDRSLWDARGAINALAVPLIAVSVARNPQWKMDLFVSRQVVFHSTTAIGAGLYLLLMSATGYYIRYYGGSWGVALQTIFFFGAVIVLLVLMFSSQLRAELKVFLAKHFYRNQYDYREEWLKFTETLSKSGDSPADVYDTVLGAIAQILNSPAAMLWIEDDEGGYRAVSSRNVAVPEQHLESNAPLAQFLEHTGWVVNLDEETRGPAGAPPLAYPPWLVEFADAWLIAPLMLQKKLFGFVILARSPARRQFSWEDSDLLKTIGRQTASYLALLKTSDALAQARQFEAFNRLSAFIVHDLKNVVAQLGLISANAAKHRDKPEFFDDVLETVDNAVAKMNRLLQHLKHGGAAADRAQGLDLRKVLSEVIASRSAETPAPVLSVATESELRVSANEDRLAAVLKHIVQNAQEATDAEGSVQVRLSREAEHAAIEVIDTGCGMTPDFIRTRLFKPFETTKGNAGMGIGVFESREFVRGLGGDVSVASTPGAGTTFRISIPLLEVPDTSPAPKEAEGG